MNTHLTNAKNDYELISIWLFGKAKTTQSVYRSIAVKFIQFVGKSLATIKIEDLQLWINSLELRYKPSTIKNKILVVKSLFSFGFKLNYLSANIGALIKNQSIKNELANRIINKDDIQALINGINSDRDRLIIQSMYYLGLRVSEVINLTLNDINNGRLTIFGKGGKTRIICLPKWLELALIAHSTGNNDYIFKSRTGKKMTRDAIHDLVKKWCGLTGLNNNISCHFFRHSHASHSLENGASISLVQASLGHSSIVTTQKYLHINPDQSSSLFL